MSYYKYTTPEAVAAWDEADRQRADLKQKADSFCDLFGGKPVYLNTASDVRLAGIKFTGKPYGNSQLWTKPIARDGNVQRPRKTVPAALKEESAALHQLWSAQFPDAKEDRSALYESVGFDWGTLIFSGMAMFRNGDTIYVETSATPNAEAGAVEILGSEYAAAKAKAVD